MPRSFLLCYPSKRSSSPAPTRTPLRSGMSRSNRSGLTCSVLDRDLLPYSWYRDNLTAHYPDIRWPDESAERAEVLARFLALNSRQAIFLADPDEAILSRHVWQAHGTLYRLVSP